MPFFKSLPEDATPAAIYTKYPEIYKAWSQMIQATMNGPSPLNPSERELIFAFSAGVSGCEFVYVAHSEVAYALGIENGLIERLLQNIENTNVEKPLKALLIFARKLMLTPNSLLQEDADKVFNEGWNEQALHDVIAIVARASFMQRLVSGHGLKPMTREVSTNRAKQRIEHGYVNLYPKFREEK